MHEENKTTGNCNYCRTALPLTEFDNYDDRRACNYCRKCAKKSRESEMAARMEEAYYQANPIRFGPG